MSTKPLVSAPKHVVQLGEEASAVVKALQEQYPLSARRATDVLARAFNRLTAAQQADCLKRGVPRKRRSNGVHC